MRKKESGHAKRVRKRRLEELTNSQKGALNKFFIKSSPVESSSLNVDNAFVIDENDDNVDDDILMNERDNENMSEEEANIDSSSHVENVSLVSNDPGTWKKIDQKLRDLLVERGPSRVLKDNDSDFSKDVINRYFSSTLYVRHLPNGDKQDRKWLVYSNSANKVFCFCCKLFKHTQRLSQLVGEGRINDWHNLPMYEAKRAQK